jgi:hypothetical protein
MIDPEAARKSALEDAVRVEALSVLSCFRQDLYDCLTTRADSLFELADALLCADGPVKSLVDLTLTAEHRRGHGALYDALNCGRIGTDRLRAELASLPVPRTADGRIVLAVDVSPRGCARTRRPARTGSSAMSTGARRASRSSSRAGPTHSSLRWSPGARHGAPTLVGSPRDVITGRRGSLSLSADFRVAGGACWGLAAAFGQAADRSCGVQRLVQRGESDPVCAQSGDDGDQVL